MEQKVLGIVSPVPMGNWASNTVYQNLNIVRHNGASYIAKSSNTNIEPGVTVGWGSYWMLLNDDGEIGPTGPQGIPGEGVPAGGLAGYLLSKNSNTNYDSKWIPQNEIEAGSAEKDGQGNIIPDTYETKQNAQQIYETKSDSMQKYTSLQSQITQNTQTVSRNSKRLDGLEQRINPSPFVTDNSVAYQKDVPSNAVGAVDIQVVGGMTYKDGNTLRSAPVTEVKSVGANLWDEQWSLGQIYIESGNPSPDGTRIISKNFIPLDGDTEYHFSYDDNGNVFYCYDENYSFIGVKYQWDNKFTTLPNTRYVKFMLPSAYGTTYNNDIMLNKGSTALPYTPYVEHTLPIPTAVQALDGYGEGVNESVYNYIDLEKKQFVKRVGNVDLGTLDWKYSTSASAFFVEIKDGKYGSNNALMPKYSKVNGEAIFTTDKAFTFGSNFIGGGSCSFVIHDTAYTDVATFKAAMSGVMLYYELATPVVTDISGLITSDNLLSIQGNGILTFENEYGYAVPSTVEYITAEATA